MMRRIATVAMMCGLMAGCGGPKAGGVYVTGRMADGWADRPEGSEAVRLGEGSIVRVLDAEDDGGRRYFKLHVERQTGTGEAGPAHEGRTVYLRAEDMEGASPTPSPR